MNFWHVNFRITYMDGDGFEAFIIRAATPGTALDRAIDKLRLGERPKVIGWTCIEVSRVTAEVIE